MIVLHAGLVGDQLHLWGECALDGVELAPRRRGAKRKTPILRHLPTAAPPTQLIEALQPILTNDTPVASEVEPLNVWMPTINDVSLPSHPLIGEIPDDTTGVELMAWQVPSLTLFPGEIIDVLGLCVDRTTLAPGVIIAPTLAFWASALRFATGIITREQFLPDLVWEESSWRARWIPHLTGKDATRFDHLARAMPHGCRALADSHMIAPTRSASDTLRAFLSVVIDALVRGRSSRTESETASSRLKRPKFDTVHDEWLYALRGPKGEMRGDADALAKFAGEVRTWRRPAALIAESPFRLCFRLEEPDELKDPWQITYLLQARDDPSLMIPVVDAWKPTTATAHVLTRGGFNPREYLLAALGQATTVCPPIEASLKTARPSGYTTDTAGANQFLTATAWLLEQAGFGILLPAWWTGHATKQRIQAKAVVNSPTNPSAGGMSLEELLKFQWRIAIGDQELTLAELEELARLKAPLVRVRGQWVHVNAEEIKAAIALLKKRTSTTMTVQEVMKLAIGADTAPGGLLVSDVIATGWVDAFLKQLRGEGTFEELPLPANVNATLRPYQIRGYSWLAFLRKFGLGACLADDMGLGKTLQTLVMLQKDREEGVKRPVLLICPTSVVGNWRKEAERFTPDLSVLIHHGDKRKKGAEFAKHAAKHAIVVSSYQTVIRDLKPIQKVKWSGVILDEAQNVKNPNTKQSIAVRSIASDFRIALTGTPVENHVGDLWALWEFINPGFLGSQENFRRTFFIPIQLERDPAAMERLKRLTGPFLLRRVKTDPTVIADLPSKNEMKVFCHLTTEQATAYATVVQEIADAMAGAEGIQRKGIILASLSKLKQVCNHPAQFIGDHSKIAGRSGKLARLTEMLDEVLQSGEKSLIFTQFTEMGELIQKHLQETFGREVLFLHGGTSRTQRDRMVTRFQTEEDGPPIFLLSLKAGGTGLNLTAANHVFHFDRWWNPAVENQATDRAFRIGQKRSVQVHKFVCVGTLEERIDAMIEAKQSVASKVIGTGEGWLTELDNDQLRDLLTLRNSALGE